MFSPSSDSHSRSIAFSLALALARSRSLSPSLSISPAPRKKSPRHTHMLAPLQQPHSPFHNRTHAHARTHTHTHARTRTRTHARTRTHTHTRLCACVIEFDLPPAHTPCTGLAAVCMYTFMRILHTDETLIYVQKGREVTGRHTERQTETDTDIIDPQESAETRTRAHACARTPWHPSMWPVRSEGSRNSAGAGEGGESNH